MVDADGIDLVLRPGRSRVEDASWNFLGFVAGVLQSDGLGCFHWKKLRSSAGSGSRRDRVGGDLAVERSDGEIRIDGDVLSKFLDLFGPELSRGNLLGLHAGALQNGPQECDVGSGPSDDADLMTGQIGDLSDLSSGLFLGVLARSPGG